ncbi:hypothetical protein Deba_0460 [Desulfarculus baarsii DSM 2075]|uniref:Uncharacterized protein n=1 Tax=Desulfarculus baarsii (strain ATCC 33931 / DSM 2075 / LMG 7858 / VKM B-1802 / 2st14) TaxID=644282 RepID=E1QE47_DESB2|nr:hypothetical protein [Desulfarculus baarsii]ADK83833.1 hypothetical protein Deba_0460 [Desulfarculus baarsii DSM 2075]
MKKLLIILASAVALAIVGGLSLSFVGGQAMAGYPDPVASAPYRGTIPASQPVGEGTVASETDHWNVPTALQGQAGAAEKQTQPAYHQAPNDADHWNVPNEFGEKK